MNFSGSDYEYIIAHTHTQILYCDTMFTLSNEIAFVIKPGKLGKTHGYVKKPTGSGGFKMPREATIHFAIAGRSRKKLALLAGSDLIGCRLRLQRLLPYTSDTCTV